jgi:hypothetical protein
MTLTVAGVYDHFCAPYEQAGMVGRIVVGVPIGPRSLPFDWFKGRAKARDWLPVPEAARGLPTNRNDHAADPRSRPPGASVPLGFLTAWLDAGPAISARLGLQRVQHQRRVRVGPAGSHFCRHPDRFHEFLRCRSGSTRCLRVSLDAIWALRDVGHRNRNYLFHPVR